MTNLETLRENLTVKNFVESLAQVVECSWCPAQKMPHLPHYDKCAKVLYEWAGNTKKNKTPKI